MIGITFDITDRKVAENELWRLANHDALTGLANRVLFHERLTAALEAAETSGTSVSLLLLDLDDFKSVNDTLGHDAGDRLLGEAARRLTAKVRVTDTVARLGGDEFAIILVGADLDSGIRIRARTGCGPVANSAARWSSDLDQSGASALPGSRLTIALRSS